MSTKGTWEGAERAAGRLSALEWAIIRLLLRLPLLWAEPLRTLVDAPNLAAVYEALDGLRQGGLIAARKPAWRAGHNPRLYHLTDLGVAVMALDSGDDPTVLAEYNTVRWADLLKHLAGLPQLACLYELLDLLARSGPGTPQVLTWERPWRGMVPYPGGRSMCRARLPAYVEVGWEGLETASFLVADGASVPIRYYRVRLQAALHWARLARVPLPPLLIMAADGHRADLWQDMLQQLNDEAGQPLRAAVAWPGCAFVPDLSRWPAGDLQPQGVPSAPLAREPAERIPRSVGAATGRAPLARAGKRAIDVTPAELRMLDLVARHPFLSVGQIAVFTEATRAEASARLCQLLKAKLIEEFPEHATPAQCGRIYEATAAGLQVAAARIGLSLRAAVRYCHLVGGGAEHPTVNRGPLVRHLPHTCGINRTMAQFVATSPVTSALAGDGLLHWEREFDAADWGIYPDGYGVFRLAGKPWGFFLEFDRGTMRRRDYERKIEAYYRYRDSGRFRGRYEGEFPCLLFVTTTEMAEERFGVVANAAKAGRTVTLDVWLTTQARIGAANRYGLIGRIWRKPADDFDARQHWPATSWPLTRRSA